MKTIAERATELAAAHPPITEEQRREVVRILGPVLRPALRSAMHPPRARKAAA